jgi:hypothetical protein
VKKLLILTGMAAALGACANKADFHWEGNPTNFDRDNYACAKENMERVSYANAYYAGSDMRLNGPLYRQCMHARGYHEVPNGKGEG